MPLLSRYDGATDTSRSSSHPDGHIDPLATNNQQQEEPNSAPFASQAHAELECMPINLRYEERGAEIVRQILSSGCSAEEQLLRLGNARQDPTLTRNDHHTILAARISIRTRQGIIERRVNRHDEANHAHRENFNPSASYPSTAIASTTTDQTYTPSSVPTTIPATIPPHNTPLTTVLTHHIHDNPHNRSPHQPALFSSETSPSLPIPTRHIIRRISNEFPLRTTDSNTSNSAHHRTSQATVHAEVLRIRHEITQLRLTLARGRFELYRCALQQLATARMAAVQCLGSVNSEHARQGREGQGRREVRRAVSAGPGVAQSGYFFRYGGDGGARFGDCDDENVDDEDEDEDEDEDDYYYHHHHHHHDDNPPIHHIPHTPPPPPHLPNLPQQQAPHPPRKNFPALSNTSLLQTRITRTLAGLRTRDMDTEILQRVMRDPHHWGDVGKLMVRSRWWQPVPLCPNEWEDGDEEERVVWSTHGFHSQEAMIAE
ncbi:hypothetical protein IAQ61_001965 [Plenodomus lingam]|uniref:uncharacterized protein n=1 Tax=Leptosphaeria maculans TaxID=5022 RepID=UPI003326753E|nr:hypothetical protein IAQ61_001965 [Plenodomus lingam]